MADLRHLTAPKVETSNSGLDPVTGFTKSLAWSPLELIGVRPTLDVEQWRSEHPVASFASQAAGYTIPYVGWEKAAMKVPQIAGAVEKVAGAEKLAEAPFKAGIAREFVKFAPFEAARIGAAATLGPSISQALGTDYSGLGDVAGSAALDLGIIGAVGGGFAKLASGGKAAKSLKGVRPGTDLNEAPQLQLRKMEDLLTKGEGDPDLLKSAINSAQYQVRDMGLDRYVYKLGNNDARAVNRLFKAKHSEGLTRSKLYVSATQPSFRDKGALEDVLSQAELPPGYEAFTQTPRFVAAKDPKIVDRILKNNLDPLDTQKGLYYRRDEGDGLFVVARKVKQGWVILKTDSPERFAPGVKDWAKVMEERTGVFGSKYKPPTELGFGAETFDTGVKFMKDVPLVDTRGLDMRKGLAKALWEKSGLSKVVGDSELASRFRNFTDEYLAPAMFQGRGNPIYGRSVALARLLKDTAEGMAEKVFVGPRALSGRSNLFKEVLYGVDPKLGGNALKQLIAEVYKNPAEAEAVWRTVQSAQGIEHGIKEYGLGETGVKFLKTLGAVDDWQMLGVQKAQLAAGEKIIDPKPFHFMLSRTWKGDWRVPVVEGKNVIGYASGFQRGDAIKQAQRIIAKAAEDGYTWHARTPALSGQLEQDLVNLRGLSLEGAQQFGKYVNKAAPKTLSHTRTGAAYYTGYDKPWSQKELEELVLKQLRKYQGYQAKLGTNALLKQDLDSLRGQDYALYEQLVDRLNKVYGEPGKIAQAVNEASDKLLSPYLGKNSASKIVGTANKYMFRWTLGFWNVGYNAANMLTFMQTAYPHLSFLTTASPSRISQYYTYYPVKGIATRNGLGVLDVFKLTKQSFREMGRPDSLLRKHFERAAQEGVWDPRFIEEFVGEKSKTVLQLKQVLSGDQPFSEWFGAAADLMPGFTEKFARGHSFVLGRTFFRDVMGVQDEELLYQLSKQFVEKTQFLYSTGDRASIITGPMGSAVGLFKNWIMHYIGWMAEYTGEGVLRGNWAPLLWMMGSTAALGGAAALPIYGAVDAMSEAFSDRSMMKNIYTMFNVDGDPVFSDAVMYGLPAFFGFSIQNQVSAPGANPGRDASQLFSLAYVDRLNYAAKAFGSAVDTWSTTGQHPGADPHTRDLLMRAFAPRAMYKVTETIQDAALRSLSTGYPVIEGLSTSQRVMHGLGLPPLEVEKHYRAADELWNDQNAMRAAIQAYGQQYAEAIQAGDWRTIDSLVARATVQGVNMSSIIKSAKARLAKGQEDSIDRQFTPAAALEYKELGILRGQQ